MTRFTLALTAAAFVTLGNGASCSTQQGVADVTIGLNAAACIIQTVVADEQGGQNEVAAIADAVIKCGVTAAQATGLLAAYRKGETLEGFVPKAAR